MMNTRDFSEDEPSDRFLHAAYKSCETMCTPCGGSGITPFISIGLRRATQIDFRRCECIDRVPNRFTKIVGEALKPSGTETWKDRPVSRSSGVTAIVQGSLLPQPSGAQLA